MKQSVEQEQNKSDNTPASAVNITNKKATRPTCYSTAPARYCEDCQDCHFIFECHTKYNELLFYGPES